MEQLWLMCQCQDLRFSGKDYISFDILFIVMGLILQQRSGRVLLFRKARCADCAPPCPGLTLNKTEQVKRRCLLCTCALTPSPSPRRPPRPCFLVVIADVSPLCHTPLRRGALVRFSHHGKTQTTVRTWKSEPCSRRCGVTTCNSQTTSTSAAGGNAGRRRQSGTGQPRCSQRHLSAGRRAGLFVRGYSTRREGLRYLRYKARLL